MLNTVPIETTDFPPSLAGKIYDQTGGPNIGRGFIMLYVNKSGGISAVSKSESEAISMGLHHGLMGLANRIGMADLGPPPN